MRTPLVRRSRGAVSSALIRSFGLAALLLGLGLVPVALVGSVRAAALALRAAAVRAARAHAGGRTGRATGAPGRASTAARARVAGSLTRLALVPVLFLVLVAHGRTSRGAHLGVTEMVATCPRHTAHRRAPGRCECVTSALR